MKGPDDYLSALDFYRRPESVAAYASVYRDQPLLDFESILLKRFLPPRAGKILVVGAGTGREARALAGCEAAVFCFDQSPAMSARGAAETAGAGLRWFAGDAVRLPVRDGAVDAVLAFNVLHTLVQGRDPEDPRARLLRECARALKPGGVLLFWVRLAYWPALQALLFAAGLPSRLARALAAPEGSESWWRLAALHPDPFSRERLLRARSAADALRREIVIGGRHAARAARHLMSLLPRAARAALRAAGRRDVPFPDDICHGGQWGHLFTENALRRLLRDAGFEAKALLTETDLLGAARPWRFRSSYFGAVAAVPKRR